MRSPKSRRFRDILLEHNRPRNYRINCVYKFIACRKYFPAFFSACTSSESALEERRCALRNRGGRRSARALIHIDR